MPIMAAATYPATIIRRRLLHPEDSSPPTTRSVTGESRCTGRPWNHRAKQRLEEAAGQGLAVEWDGGTAGEVWGVHCSVEGAPVPSERRVRPGHQRHCPAQAVDRA
ncbi:hypothetical protein NDU88_002332 [Pleurodeles waltl]|uniref:Uncharacterized protein n=1 Tax=Pleurodeles waltl TaxID=8319 RepID=A0AAV7TMT7_PLEWA|nr:hypothetical protein NDU88_002332 [Pleurodeles waltl]